MKQNSILPHIEQNGQTTCLHVTVVFAILRSQGIVWFEYFHDLRRRSGCRTKLFGVIVDAESIYWCIRLTALTHFYSNSDHTRCIRKGLGVTKSDACAQKMHTMHAVFIQLKCVNPHLAHFFYWHIAYMSQSALNVLVRSLIFLQLWIAVL